MLIFVDFSAGVVGITYPQGPFSTKEGIIPWLKIVSEGRIPSGCFQWVGDGVVGPLAVLEAFLRRKITEKDIGKSFQLNEFHAHPEKHSIRPCQAEFIPFHVCNFAQKSSLRKSIKAYEWNEEFWFNSCRRKVFSMSKAAPIAVARRNKLGQHPVPERAVAYVPARVKKSTEECIVYLDKFARPVKAVQLVFGNFELQWFNPRTCSVLELMPEEYEICWTNQRVRSLEDL